MTTLLTLAAMFGAVRQNTPRVPTHFHYDTNFFSISFAFELFAPKKPWFSHGEWHRWAMCQPWTSGCAPASSLFSSHSLNMSLSSGKTSVSLFSLWYFFIATLDKYVFGSRTDFLVHLRFWILGEQAPYTLQIELSWPTRHLDTDRGWILPPSNSRIYRVIILTGRALKVLSVGDGKIPTKKVKVRECHRNNLKFNSNFHFFSRDFAISNT